MPIVKTLNLHKHDRTCDKHGHLVVFAIYNHRLGLGLDTQNKYICHLDRFIPYRNCNIHPDALDLWHQLDMCVIIILDTLWAVTIIVVAIRLSHIDCRLYDSWVSLIIVHHKVTEKLGSMESIGSQNHLHS